MANPLPTLCNSIRKIALSFSSGSITKLTLCSGFSRGRSFETVFRKEIAHISGLNLVDKVFVEGLALLIIAADKATICAHLILWPTKLAMVNWNANTSRLTCWQTGAFPELSLWLYKHYKTTPNSVLICCTQ